MKRTLLWITDRLFMLPLLFLPHHLLSRIVHRLTRSENRLLSQFLIRTISSRYNIDLSIAQDPDLSHYKSFNRFFTRPIRPEARPIDSTDGSLVSPVDGAISQCGAIQQQSIFQAKGHQFNLNTLLGGLETRARPFVDGTFATIYLSPRDYHRIHMPIEGTLREMVYIPGRLYPVNNPSTRTVPGLFARNERVAAIFDTPAGPMAMILVGALFVGSIETVWVGEVTPPTRKTVQTWRYDDNAPTFEKGDEMGRFNMGSTVILLFAQSRSELLDSLQSGSVVKMGERIGTFTAP